MTSPAIVTASLDEKPKPKSSFISSILTPGQLATAIGTLQDLWLRLNRFIGQVCHRDSPEVTPYSLTMMAICWRRFFRYVNNRSILIVSGTKAASITSGVRSRIFASASVALACFLYALTVVLSTK